MSQAYIVECVRSPIGVGKKGGSLNNVHPVNLLATVLDELVKRAQIDKSLIEDVICGCVTPLREQGANIPRIALLKAGFPVHVPGVQLNRMCGSGQQAVHFASQAVASGDMDLVIGCGIEMMSVVQMVC
jgi:acetyl-CoA acyltransferase